MNIKKSLKLFNIQAFFCFVFLIYVFEFLRLPFLKCFWKRKTLRDGFCQKHFLTQFLVVKKMAVFKSKIVFRLKSFTSWSSLFWVYWLVVFHLNTEFVDTSLNRLCAKNDLKKGIFVRWDKVFGYLVREQKTNPKRIFRVLCIRSKKLKKA